MRSIPIQIVAFLAPLGILAPHAAAPAAKPDLSLRVSTHSGPLPLDLKLTGVVTGASMPEYTSCLITVEYVYRTPAGSWLNSKKEMPCIEPDPELKEAADPLPPSFERQHVLVEPGTYSYRLVIVRADGRWQASASQEVKAYRSHVEAAVAGSTSRADR